MIYFRCSLFLFFLVTLLSTSVRADGHGVGNGGGGWACVETDAAKTIRWFELSDLFEAENEFGLQIDFNSSPVESQADAAIAFLKQHFPEFGAQVEEDWLHIKKVKIETEEPIPYMGDQYFRFSPDPNSCVGGKIEFISIVNYRNRKHIQFQSYYFNHPKFLMTDRAALYVHEAIYAALRNSKDHDINSIRTRLIVGYLFSGTPIDRTIEIISYILAHPELQDADSAKDKSRSGKNKPQYGKEETNTLNEASHFFRNVYSGSGKNEPPTRKSYGHFKQDLSALPPMTNQTPNLLKTWNCAGLMAYPDHTLTYGENEFFNVTANIDDHDKWAFVAPNNFNLTADIDDQTFINQSPGSIFQKLKIENGFLHGLFKSNFIQLEILLRPFSSTVWLGTLVETEEGLGGTQNVDPGIASQKVQSLVTYCEMRD